MEILFVVVVIAVLAAIAIPRITDTVGDAKANACDSNVANLNTQIEMYHFKTGKWPSKNMKELNVADYFPDGLPKCPVDGKAYAMDATSHRVKYHSH